ncbi:glycosyltransferase family 4 protein [Roseimicrobium sp. ORNL1]|uniref:glycosyltransferase family 4 protein n=1 Tax=Roseimicrobium sp. ORNL1 TaxID=2711231 RepID=UPI0013E124BA|nr:glycosyltransferase family 4 protein [Roseimicrobium sp. ORNL1]QIF05776.1 glycosyltransferase family 4 protein [Roseimicrobium sp. ORNL1]
MRILFWCEIFLPHVGGVEILVSQLAQALVREGHACAILTNRHALDLPDKEMHHGAEIHRIDFVQTLQSRDPRRLHHLCQQVKKIREDFAPDLHHFFLAGPLVMLLQMTNRAPALPVVTTLQTPLDTVLQGGASTLRLLRESALIIAANRVLLEGIPSAVPETAGKMHLLPNSVHSPTIPPCELPWDPPVLLCLGRLAPEKGFDVALHALALLPEHWSHVRMMVVGEGTERSNLETLCRKLGLSGRVHFHGGVPNDEVPAMVNQSTLVLLPSRWQEPFGIVCLEAAVMQRAVVASRVGGVPEVVEEGVSGLLVEPENPEELASAIASLLDDPVKLRAMGEQASQLAEARFGYRSYLEKHLQWYREASGATPPIHTSVL